MKIQIVIPIWKRPEVTKFCFSHLHRMIAALSHKVSVLCVISELEYVKVCEENGFEWVMIENNPLGRKINSGIKHALRTDWDYLMMMNSDNVIKPELIEKYYQPFFDKGVEFFGISRVTYVKFDTKEARDYEYEFSVLGIGKCVKRSVVEKFNGELYRNDLNRCLDDTMIDRMVSARVSPHIVRYEGQLAMDFKSEVNIWPWEKFEKRGKPVCYSLE